MNTRTKQLDALMKEHGLTARQVGEMIGRTAHTVRVWRSKYEHRVIPEHTLSHLLVKIAERAGGAA